MNNLQYYRVWIEGRTDTVRQIQAISPPDAAIEFSRIYDFNYAEFNIAKYGERIVVEGHGIYYVGAHSRPVYYATLEDINA